MTVAKTATKSTAAKAPTKKAPRRVVKVDIHGKTTAEAVAAVNEAHTIMDDSGQRKAAASKEALVAQRTELRKAIGACAEDIVGLGYWLTTVFPDIPPSDPFGYYLFEKGALKKFSEREDAIFESFDRLVQTNLNGVAHTPGAIDDFRGLIKDVFQGQFVNNVSDVSLGNGPLYDHAIGYLEQAVISNNFLDSHRALVKDMIAAFLSPKGDSESHLRYSKERTMAWYSANPTFPLSLLEGGFFDDKTNFSEQMVAEVLKFAIKQMLRTSIIALQLGDDAQHCAQTIALVAKTKAGHYLNISLEDADHGTPTQRALCALLHTSYSLAVRKYQDMRASYLLSDSDLRSAVKYGFINFRSLREARTRLHGAKAMYSQVYATNSLNVSTYEESIQDVFNVVLFCAAASANK